MKQKGGVFGNAELVTAFKSLDESLQGQALVNTVQAGGTVVVDAAKDNIKKQGLIRTRHLSRSVHLEVAESTNEHAAVDAGTDVEYAALHEFGGTVQAKSSKYLAIPVGSYRGSPRKHGDLKVRKTGGGNLVMVDEAGVVQYVLKKSITVPAKPYMRPAADENHEKVTSAMADAWQQQIQKAVRA